MVQSNFDFKRKKKIDVKLNGEFNKIIIHNRI